MMKVATGEGSPLRQGAGTGLDWLSVATEASGGGTPDLLFRVAFLPKISSVKFQVNWTPYDFPFLRYSKTRKKPRNWPWALGQ